MKNINKLIVLEGIDGVGKTTIAHELKKILKKKGIPVILYEDYEIKHTNFNVLKPLVKKMPIVGSHLFYLSSAIYKSQVISKLLKEKWVICDRYYFSSVAYHKTNGSNLEVSSLNDILLPDYGFLLTVDESIRRKRIMQKTHITKSDLIPKKPGLTPYVMENYLKEMNLIEIDNSISIKETLQTIIEIIFKNAEHKKIMP
jgi:dTMP kinase